MPDRLNAEARAAFNARDEGILNMAAVVGADSERVVGQHEVRGDY